MPTLILQVNILTFTNLSPALENEPETLAIVKGKVSAPLKLIIALDSQLPHVFHEI